MFKTRLISGIVLVILLAAVLVLGGGILWGFLLFISMVGLFEFYRAVRDKQSTETKKVTPLEFAGYAGTVVYYVILLVTREERLLFLTLVMVLTACMFVYVLSYPRFQATDIMSTYFGFLYVPVMLSFIYLTRTYTDGIHLVWLVFISSWVCDTCAYCAGMLLGKHKLVPKLSPKKTVEGAIGGILGASLVGALFGLYLSNVLLQDTAIIWMLAVICGVGAIVSQIGDLTASAIKRNHDIKDYGNLIPGHGGILDRFDSVIVTAPMIYILAVMIIGK